MSVRDAVIVSTARTGIGRAYRGAFNATPSPTLAAHPIRAAVERAKLDPAEINDVSRFLAAYHRDAGAVRRDVAGRLRDRIQALLGTGAPTGLPEGNSGT